MTAVAKSHENVNRPGSDAMSARSLVRQATPRYRVFAPRRRSQPPGTLGFQSAEVEDCDATLGFVFFFLWTPSRLMDFEGQLQPRLLPLLAAPLFLFSLPNLLDDERG